MSILQHDFFKHFNHYSVLHQTYDPPFIPHEPDTRDTSPRRINSTLHAHEITKLLKFKQYTGDHDVFKDFGPLTEDE